MSSTEEILEQARKDILDIIKRVERDTGSDVESVYTERLCIACIDNPGATLKDLRIVLVSDIKWA